MYIFFMILNVTPLVKLVLFSYHVAGVATPIGVMCDGANCDWPRGSGTEGPPGCTSNCSY